MRRAKLVIDSTSLEEYLPLLKEEIEASLKLEPGVLTLYAVSEKEKPNHMTILEIYASEEDYQKHIASPHNQKYKNATVSMVKSLELIEADPLLPNLHHPQSLNQVVLFCIQIKSSALIDDSE